MSSNKQILIKRLPVIISNNKKISLINRKDMNDILKSKVKIAMPMYKDDVIFESTNCDFLKGDSQNVKIINRINIITKCCRTIAKCGSKGIVETTSDEICALIGQKSYDTVLSALGSVFNEEVKVKGILALLKPPRKVTASTTQTDTKVKLENNSIKTYVDSGSQTEESSIEFFQKLRSKKRIKKQQFYPYAVRDKPEKKLKKIVINIDNIPNKGLQGLQTSTNEKVHEEKLDLLPDISDYVDEDSKISDISFGNISLSSVPSVTDLLMPQTTCLQNIDKHTETKIDPVSLSLPDGTKIMIPVKPEDQFHIATPEILKHVTNEEKIKLTVYQAHIDWKTCIQKNEDGYLPIHLSVMHNDLDLLRRQCLALQARQVSVDVENADNLTALQISIRGNQTAQCTALLLQHGASPLKRDNQCRTSFHLAAEAPLCHLQELLQYCRQHARQILQDSEELWSDHYEKLSNDELAEHFFNLVGFMYDDQGYTPLMIASGAGRAQHTALLCAVAPRVVNAQTPTCGATALYRAVAAACHHAIERGNRTRAADHFEKTIEKLVETGADPAIDNHAGVNVNDLLTEFNISSLSLTIANKMTSMKFFNGTLPNNSNIDRFMLYKDKGEINIKSLEVKKVEKPKKETKKVKEPSRSIIIVDDVALKPTNKIIISPDGTEFSLDKEIMNAKGNKVCDTPNNIVLKNKYIQITKGKPQLNFVSYKRPLSPPRLTQVIQAKKNKKT